VKQIGSAAAPKERFVEPLAEHGRRHDRKRIPSVPPALAAWRAVAHRGRTVARNRDAIASHTGLAYRPPPSAG